MFNKFRKLCVIMLLSVGLNSLFVAPAAAFFGFCFGMDNNGPFMSFHDNGRNWHFNTNHPFGHYSSIYNRYGSYKGPWNSPYGYGNRYFPNPNVGQYSYPQFRQWPGGWGRAPAGFAMTPWNGFSPWVYAPYRRY